MTGSVHLTWRLDTTAGIPGGLNPDELLAEIDASFKSWENADVFFFSQAGDEQADIVLRFANPPGEDFEGRKGSIAKAYFPWASRRGEIYLNPTERWSTARFAVSREPLMDWLPHQIGHVLGLKDDSITSRFVVPSRFMVPYGPHGMPDDWALNDLRRLYAVPRPEIVSMN